MTGKRTMSKTNEKGTTENEAIEPLYSNSNVGAGPAYPTEFTLEPKTGAVCIAVAVGENKFYTPGMSRHDLASITLGVADTGCDWMDEMIKAKERKDKAFSMYCALVSDPTLNLDEVSVNKAIESAYSLTDKFLNHEAGN